MDTLETKLALLIERYHAMREENLRLRQKMVTLENTNKRLSDRLAQARGRMEDLFNTLPD